jgi:hypothetical protein
MAEVSAPFLIAVHPEKELIGALCYSTCPSGMYRYGFDCHAYCPSGFRDGGPVLPYRCVWSWSWLCFLGRLENAIKITVPVIVSGGAPCTTPRCADGYYNTLCCICTPNDIDCNSFPWMSEVPDGASGAKQVLIGDPTPMVCSSTYTKLWWALLYSL